MHKNQKKFTLEEMLSIKKAEKPSISEWENFNAQLKSKMLKSMVEQENKKSFFTPWAFAKIGAICVPVFGLMLGLYMTNSSVEEVSLQRGVEIFQIPDIKNSYYSDNYMTVDSTNTEYAKDMIQSTSANNIVYAISDIQSAQNFSF